MTSPPEQPAETLWSDAEAAAFLRVKADKETMDAVADVARAAVVDLGAAGRRWKRSALESWTQLGGNAHAIRNRSPRPFRSSFGSGATKGHRS